MLSIVIGIFVHKSATFFNAFIFTLNILLAISEITEFKGFGCVTNQNIAKCINCHLRTTYWAQVKLCWWIFRRLFKKYLNDLLSSSNFFHNILIHGPFSDNDYKNLWMPNLKNLEVCNNDHITDEKLISLSKCFPSLECLNLAGEKFF